MPLLFLISHYLLAAIFAVAAVAKLRDLAGTRKTLVAFGLSKSLAKILTPLLPTSELALAGLLLPRSTASLAGAGLLALLSIFTIAIAFNLLKGRKLNCRCFGALTRSEIGSSTIIRNIVLLIMAGLVASGRSGEYDPTTITSPLLTGALAFVALTLMIACWVLFHVLRQNGRLLLRLEAVEKKLGIDPNTQPALGLPIGTPIPQFALDGLRSSDLLDHAEPLLLTFVDSNCGACEALLPDLARWQAERSEQFSVLVIGSGNAFEIRAKVDSYGIANLFLQKASEVSDVFLASGTPAAVLLQDGKIASALAEGSADIRKLIEQSIPEPAANSSLEIGTPVPALHLNDLNGEPFAIASLLGHRTVILFWSTTCGYCDQMLDEIKAWERDHSEPELLVISAGTIETHREQGFRSRVLLDDNFSASNALGSSGTPSAILIDENARVASPIRVGSREVMALMESAAPVAVTGKKAARI